MADFGKISSEKALLIISALKDGSLDEKEMKELGLTESEKEYLMEAFSSGEVQIGDYVLVNKGKGKNNKGQTVQYTQTKKAEQQEETQEEPGFWSRAWNRIKRDVSSYGENFTKAWNNSEGFLEKTGALLGATTETVTDIVKNNAEYVEKGVADVTGSDTAGKVASIVLGIGLVADAAKAVEEVGDWSSEKIREAAKNYDGTERELLESFADFVDDMNAVDIALMFVGGAGAVKGFKDLPKVLKLLQGAGGATAAASATGVGGASKAVAVAAGLAMASCVEFNNTEIITLEERSLAEELGISPEELKALLVQLTIDLATLVEQGETNQQILQLILDKLCDMDTNMQNFYNNIRNDMEGSTAKIINAIQDLQADVNALTNLVATLPEDIKNAFGADLQAILKAIKDNGKSLSDIKNMLKALGEKIISQLDTNNQYQKDIKALLEQLNAGQINDSAFIAEMFNLLKDIKNIAGQINNKLDVIIDKLKNLYKQNINIQKSLNKIADFVQANGEKIDVTNELLNQLLELAQTQGGLTEAQLEAILKAISENTSKIDETNELIKNLKTVNEKFQKEILDFMANIGVEMNAGLTALINAINEGNASINDVKALLASIETLVQQGNNDMKAFGDQLLEYMSVLGFEMKSNYTALINAVKEGNADIKEIKALLANLTKLVEQGNDDAKALGDKIFAYLVEHNGQMAQKFDTIISLISDLKSGQGDLSVSIKEFLENVLNNQNNNTEKIINAMANIKVEGGKVDLSSVEKMLAELIKLVGQNGKQLSDINAKMDVISVTIESAKNEILKHLKAGNSTTNAILNALNEFKKLSNENDQKILAKMDTIMNLLTHIKPEKYDDSALMAKLDDILAAIKDHDVKIDVTGKVTCECNCGNGTQHEGILGDLNDILG